MNRQGLHPRTSPDLGHRSYPSASKCVANEWRNVWLGPKTERRTDVTRPTLRWSEKQVSGAPLFARPGATLSLRPLPGHGRSPTVRVGADLRRPFCQGALDRFKEIVSRSGGHAQRLGRGLGEPGFSPNLSRLLLTTTHHTRFQQEPPCYLLRSWPWVGARARLRVCTDCRWLRSPRSRWRLRWRGAGDIPDRSRVSAPISRGSTVKFKADPALYFLFLPALLLLGCEQTPEPPESSPPQVRTENQGDASEPDAAVADRIAGPAPSEQQAGTALAEGEMATDETESTGIGRSWTDATGKHLSDADWIDLKDGIVRLKRHSDGKVISLPLKKLSQKRSGLCDKRRRSGLNTRLRHWRTNCSHLMM